MGIRKDTGIEKTRTITVEEVFRVGEKRRKSLKSLICIGLKAADIDNVSVFEELVPSCLLKL